MTLKYVHFMLLALVVSVSTAATPTIAYAEQWKTYYNPEFEFIIQYPDYPYLNFDVGNNSTQMTLYSNSLVDYTVNMGLVIQPLNTSEHPDLLGFVEDTYNNIIPNNEDYKILQNITVTEYASYPSYTFTHSSKDVNPNEYTIHRAVYQLHDDLIYIFWMANSNKDYHGRVFDEMVNTIKFFD